MCVWDGSNSNPYYSLESHASLVNEGLRMYFWLSSAYFHIFSSIFSFALEVSKCPARGVSSWCTPSLALALLCRLTATSPLAELREGGMQVCGWICHPISLFINQHCILWNWSIRPCQSDIEWRWKGTYELTYEYIYILYIYDSLWSSPKFRELLQDGSRMYLITCNNRWQDNRYRSSLWFHHVSCGQAVHRMLRGPVEFQRRSMVAQAESSFWFGEFCHALAHRSTGPSHGAHHSRVPQLENWQSTAS